MILQSKEIYNDARFLRENDALFNRFFNAHPNYIIGQRWQKRPCDFAAFADAVISQQLSIKAAATIQKRVEKRVGHITPKNILRCADTDLRACGLSGRKVEYLKGMAEAELSGAFDPSTLHAMPDQDVIANVTALRGFGVWSAQMVLIFNLTRRDIFPPLDLGVIEGLRILRRLKDRPTADAAERYAKRWAGKRTAASLLLWEVNGLAKETLKKKA